MKKYIGYLVGALVILAFILYYFLSGQGQSPAVVMNNPGDGTPATTTSQTPTPGGAQGEGMGLNPGSTGGTPTTTPTGQPQPPAGTYHDGSYKSPVTDAIYGKLQLAVTIQGGKITNITWPIFPNDPGHTTEVSNSALPILKQEAITSQSADVNIVSGATQTAEGFQQALAAALAMAKK